LWIIAGLGNPGLKYKNTRHNAGFMAIDALAKELGIRFTKSQFQAKTGEGQLGGEKVLLLKPQTFMNLSGDSISEAIRFYRLPTENLIVIYDDTDLAVGRLRIKEKGSAGTHNGMRSIIARLRTYDFVRIRIGIGKQPGYLQLKDYVLQKLPKTEKQMMEDACDRAAEAAVKVIKDGVAAAQAEFNGAEITE